MTMKRWPRSWPRSSISSKQSIIGSDFTRPSAICRQSSLKLRFRHHYFLNFLCHFRGALQSLRDGVTGNTSGFELEDEGSTPSPAANLFKRNSKVLRLNRRRRKHSRILKLCLFVFSVERSMRTRTPRRACFVLRRNCDGLRAYLITNSTRSQN